MSDAELLANLKKSKDLHSKVIGALDALVDDEHLRGYILALYGAKNSKRDRVGWRAKPEDILGTLMTLISDVTKDQKLAEEICDRIATRLEIKEIDVN